MVLNSYLSLEKYFCLQKQKTLFYSKMTHCDASFALKMIKRVASLGLRVAEISWAGG